MLIRWMEKILHHFDPVPFGIVGIAPRTPNFNIEGDVHVVECWGKPFMHHPSCVPAAFPHNVKEQGARVRTQPNKSTFKVLLV